MGLMTGAAMCQLEDDDDDDAARIDSGGGGSGAVVVVGGGGGGGGTNFGRFAGRRLSFAIFGSVLEGKFEVKSNAQNDMIFCGITTCSYVEIGRYLRPSLRVACRAGVPPRLVRGHRAEKHQEGIKTYRALPEIYNYLHSCLHLTTGLGKKVVPRLRELVPCGQRESGGGIHTT